MQCKSLQEFYSNLIERLFLHLGDSRFRLGAMTEGLNMDFWHEDKERLHETTYIARKSIRMFGVLCWTQLTRQ